MSPFPPTNAASVARTTATARAALDGGSDLPYALGRLPGSPTDSVLLPYAVDNGDGTALARGGGQTTDPLILTDPPADYTIRPCSRVMGPDLPTAAWRSTTWADTALALPSGWHRYNRHTAARAAVRLALSAITHDLSIKGPLTGYVIPTTVQFFVGGVLVATWTLPVTTPSDANTTWRLSGSQFDLMSAPSDWTLVTAPGASSGSGEWRTAGSLSLGTTIDFQPAAGISVTNAQIELSCLAWGVQPTAGLGALTPTWTAWGPTALTLPRVPTTPAWGSPASAFLFGNLFTQILLSGSAVAGPRAFPQWVPLYDADGNYLRTIVGSYDPAFLDVTAP